MIFSRFSMFVITKLILVMTTPSSTIINENTMINNLQKLIYKTISSHRSDNFNKLKGVFTHIEKNTEFPYIFINVLESQNLSNFTEEIRLFNIEISIYDKNTTGGLLVDLCDESASLFSDLKNIDSKNVIDVKFLGQDVAVQNDIMLWQGKLKFNFIVKKLLQI